MAERTSGLRSILSVPLVYRTFQRLLGAERSKRRLVAEDLRPFPGARLLDVACGPGNLLDFLPEDLDYVGFDHEPAYIQEAQERYGDRARFHCDSVAGMAAQAAELGPFDLVSAVGVLHHLDNDEARALFDLAAQVLRPGGRVVTIDPCYEDGQSPFARFLISRDRGEDVRDAEGYRRLVGEAFLEARSRVEHRRLRLPFTHHILECTRA